MGWWRIDPATGKPAKGAKSRLSQPPDRVLLNAVPGVDDDDEAHYLGDGPWDMVASYVGKIEGVFGRSARPSAAEARKLFLDRVLPKAMQSLRAASRQQILRLIEAMWADIDWCYDEDWERPARPAERKWICEYAVHLLTRDDT